MLLANLLANCDNDAFPADHRAKPESECYSNLDPVGNELGGLVDFVLVVRERSIFVRGEGRIVVFLHQANGFAGHVHIVADVCLVLRRDRFKYLVESDFVVQVFHQLAQRQYGVRLQLLGANVVGDLSAGIGAKQR